MTSAMMTEKGPFASTACFPGASAPMMAPGLCTVPRCAIKIEQCATGCKIYCSCDDETACCTLQNLCRALAGGLCSICCTWNGACICQCNLACCHCTCECTEDGVCISCTCGDKQCAAMVKACCDCLSKCCDCGCVCTVCFNNTPVCCCC